MRTRHKTNNTGLRPLKQRLSASRLVTRQERIEARKLRGPAPSRVVDIPPSSAIYPGPLGLAQRGL